jgi:hypothetical protein
VLIDSMIVALAVVARARAPIATPARAERDADLNMLTLFLFRWTPHKATDWIQRADFMPTDMDASNKRLMYNHVHYCCKKSRHGSY